MAIIGHGTGEMRRIARVSRRAAPGAPAVLPLVALALLACAALAYVIYVLWPRWPEPAALDAPEIPVTIAGVSFNLPPAAIRIGVQRRPGAHDRIDLVFLWPSLAPPNPAVKPVAMTDLPPAAANMLDRVFVTIAEAGDAIAPDERVRTIYPRYAGSTPTSGPSGLAILPFREDTPYQGEDLVYDAATPENFLVRCTRAGPTPGSCLYERRIGAADVTVRFPRDFLDDRQSLAANIDRLIASMRPRG